MMETQQQIRQYSIIVDDDVTDELCVLATAGYDHTIRYVKEHGVFLRTFS